MATVPELHVVQVPALDQAAKDEFAAATVRIWAPVEVPRGRQPSALVLAVLGTLAGVAAMALGAFAVASATSSDGRDAAAASSTAKRPAGVEARALALLA